MIRDEQEGIAAIDWRNDGKIRMIIRDTESAERDLSFTYGPSGNRLSKNIYDANGNAQYANYYIRDAQGNVMATYKMNVDTASESIVYTVAERNIYGSDRVGMYTYADTVYPVPPAPVTGFQPLWRGHRKYELKNHLGNVTSVISGNKTAVEDNGMIDHYTAQIEAAYDYSPFGVTRLSYEANYTAGTEGGEPHPLKPDLMWCMDGDGAEKYGSGHDAALYNTLPAADRNSEANKALVTSGNPNTPSHMEITDHADLDFGADDFTVSIWVKKLNGNQSRNNAVAVGKWQTGGVLGSCEWYINISNGSSGHINPKPHRLQRIPETAER